MVREIAILGVNEGLEVSSYGGLDAVVHGSGVLYSSGINPSDAGSFDVSLGDVVVGIQDALAIDLEDALWSRGVPAEFSGADTESNDK